MVIRTRVRGKKCVQCGSDNLVVGEREMQASKGTREIYIYVFPSAMITADYS